MGVGDKTQELCCQGRAALATFTDGRYIDVR